jgi:isopenicillin-N epimerase
VSSNLAQQFLLDPDVLFLNHGSFGACPRPVFEDYQRWQARLERQPVEFLDSRRGLKANLMVAREALAHELNTAPAKRRHLRLSRRASMGSSQP